MSAWRVLLAGAVAVALAAGAALAVVRGGRPDARDAAEVALPPTVAVTDAAADDGLALGRAVYARECASCHGANGEGQPDWKVPLADGSLPAPPHDASGHTWHHADAQLLEIIARGGTIYDPSSKMPAYGESLTEAEMRAVLDYLKSWWGPQERDFQRAQSEEWARMMAAPTAP